MALNSLLDSPFLLHQPFGRCLRINFHLHPEQGEDRPRLQVTSGAQLKNDLTITEPRVVNRLPVPQHEHRKEAPTF
jgi:hypothetical protein